MKLRYLLPFTVVVIVAIATLSTALDGHDKTEHTISPLATQVAHVPAGQHEVSKACMEYIRAHFNDPKGVPVNHCTVGFMPSMANSRNYQAVMLGMPVPAPMTCDISGCYLSMK